MHDLMTARLLAPVLRPWPSAETPMLLLAMTPMVLEAAIKRLAFGPVEVTSDGGPDLTFEITEVGEPPVLRQEPDHAVHVEVAQFPEGPARLLDVGAEAESLLSGCIP